jgi:hypothetical protein
MALRSKDPNVNEEAFSEQDPYDREPSVYDIKAQQAEVTPVEAFKQNVDGDQSPCIVCPSIASDGNKLTRGSQFQKSPHVCPILTIQMSHVIVSDILHDCSKHDSG